MAWRPTTPASIPAKRFRRASRSGWRRVLRFLPPDSPLHPIIGILWKHAKPFRRRLVRWEPARLHEEVDGLLPILDIFKQGLLNAFRSG